MIDLSNRWTVLGLLFLVGLTAPMQFQGVAALAPFMVAEGRLTYTDVGVLTGAFMLPGVLLSAPMGPISARLGDRLVLIAGIALMSVSGAVLAIADSYPVLLAMRLLGGAGAVAVTALLPKVVADWFSGKEIATAMAIIAASVGLGIGLAMAGLPVIAEAFTWRTALLANAVFSGLAIVLLLAVYRDAATPGGAGSRLLWRIDGPELVLSALAGVARGLFSAGYALFMSFLPPLLIARGMPPVEAGLLTGVAALASIISVPLGGYLSDRTGKPNAFIVGGALSAAAACALVPFFAPALLWIVMFGFLRGGCTGGIMSLPSRVLRPESRNTGFAIVSVAYFACMAVLPPIAGFLLDVTGSTAAPLLFSGSLWLMIIVVLAVFLMLERRWARSGAVG